MAQFSITLPKDWQLYHSEWHSDKLIYQQDGNRYTWTAKDLPYQPEEPLMPSWFWLSPRVAITYFNPSISNSPQFTNWQTVAKWCADKHQEAAIPDETVQAQTRQLTQALSTPEEQLQAIAAFVRDEIRYVAVEIGEGRWQPRPASVTLYNRYGDCKDKTALMRAMLQTLNIQSCSVLANTHYSVLPKLPSPFQFNHCIVGIPLASLSGSFSFKQNGVSGWLFFDPTDQSMRLGDLPTALQGGRGLLATQADSVLIQLPYQSPLNYRRHYFAEAELRSDGSMSANVRITDFGKWANSSRIYFKTTPKDKQIESLKSRFAKTVGMTSFLGFQTGSQNDTAWVSFQASGSRYASSMGGLIILKPDFFHENEAPELSAEQRQHPIWFGSAMCIETDIIWRFPQGWVPESELPSLESSCDAANLSCKITYFDNLLRFSSVIQQNGHMLPVEQYEVARKFSRELSKVKGMSIVLKKL